jgi:hypothetical protein
MDGQGAEPHGSVEVTDGWRRLGLTSMALWIGYFEVGGNGSLAEVEEWLAGSTNPSDRDHDYMAQALNDQFTERGLDHPMRFRLP